MTQHLGESLNNDRLVLPLASGVLRGQAQLPVGIHSMLQLLDEPLAVVIRDRRRVGKIERELGLSRSLVDMLPAGATRPRKSDVQLGSRNADLVVKDDALHCSLLLRNCR
jgi:hypothetical protein